jgi:hypothetical protein
MEKSENKKHLYWPFEADLEATLNFFLLVDLSKKNFLLKY